VRDEVNRQSALTLVFLNSLGGVRAAREERRATREVRSAFERDPFSLL
jgi:hypothetical protein